MEETLSGSTSNLEQRLCPQKVQVSKSIIFLGLCKVSFHRGAVRQLLSIKRKIFEEDKNAIQVHLNTVIKKISKHIIDEMLEDSWVITNLEELDQVFIMSITSVKSLSLIYLFPMAKIISATKVQFCEDGS